MIEDKKYRVYWHRIEKVPVIVNEDTNKNGRDNKNLKYMSTDVRPVFLEEKHLLFTLFPELGTKIYEQSVWANKANAYYINGVRFKPSILKQGSKIEDLNEFRNNIGKFRRSKKRVNSENYIFRKFIKMNEEHLNDLLKSEDEKDNFLIGAEPFIQSMKKKYDNREIVVSFSGGKDSTVVSHLVRKSLNTQDIPHLYSDTTIELPTTEIYNKKFISKNPYTDFSIFKNDSAKFMDDCRKMGPPSRVKSWCCSIFKTGPMGTKLKEIGVPILTFYGIRRSESASRSKYKKVSKSPKIKLQIVASPIIDWLDIDVWLYILSNKIEFNKAYRMGYSRVGCWCCPNNSRWSDFLTSIYFPKLYDKWHGFLLDFAKKIGKPDPEVYINEGKWKARQGGAGLDVTQTKVESKICIAKENSKSYQLVKPVNDQFYEYFKVFGYLDFNFGNKKIGKFKIQRKNEYIFEVIAKKNSRKVKITILKKDRADLSMFYGKNAISNNIFRYFEAQIRKFQTCIMCQACNSICPTGAISVTKENYFIDEQKCTNCLICVTHFPHGCLIASSLETKKEL